MPDPGKCIRDAVRHAVWYEVEDTVRDAVWYAVRDPVGDAVGHAVAGAVRIELEERLGD